MYRGSVLSSMVLYYMVTKTYSLLGRYRTTIKSPLEDLFCYVIYPGKLSKGDFISWHPGCLAAIANPDFDLEPDYIFREPMKICFQRYIVRMEIISTFHTH